jgi:phosphoglycolate phosphatase
MNRKLVLFDCDGTILDSVGIIHDSMVRTFSEAGYPAPAEAATRKIIGLTLDLAIARLLNRTVDGEVETMTARYKQHFQRLYAKPDFQQSLFPGMAGLVSGLAAREDLVLGIVTGKSRRGMEMFFDKHGLREHFATVRTADDCPSKPHPAMVLECCAEAGFDPGSTIVVGDSVFDMEMAKSAGSAAIGVAWGYNGVAMLRSAGADAIAASADELAQMLERNDA